MSARKILAGAAVVALSLTACGSSAEPTETPEVQESTVVEETIPAEETTAPEEVVDSADCSLTTEQIGDDTMEVLGSYLVDGDNLLCDPTEEAAATFAIYTNLIPIEFRDGVIGFVAIDQEHSNGTDGAMQDVSGPDGEPTGERYLALDVTGSSAELERTIVHEVGHTIFNNAGSDEPTVYAVAFNEEFAPGGSYEETPEDFVTEYAASQPDGGEDMAESWAMYVFADTDFAGDADDDGELDVVVPDTLAAEKVAFFGNYPELVTLRESILESAGF